MALSTGCPAADRFRDVGMKSPDLSFLEKKVPVGERWGKESLYNPGALVGNWYEDRRAYMRICPRVTGQTITKTDYTPKCIFRDTTFPPREYARQLRDIGEGPDILRNTQDYCEYLSNYTTTYDLMHNWEVRRAGVKAKPWRKWKLILDAKWTPERDNAVSFGNLTQIGYRKSPQVPLLPNDWDVYANNPTSNQVDFPPPNYPDDYVHCRKAATKEVRRELEELMRIKNPASEETMCESENCRCCFSKAQNKSNPRTDRMIPAGLLKEKPGMQTVYPPDAIWPYKALKHPPHIMNEGCKPFCLAPGTRENQTPFGRPDICNDYAGDVRQE